MIDIRDLLESYAKAFDAEAETAHVKGYSGIAKDAAEIARRIRNGTLLPSSTLQALDHDLTAIRTDIARARKLYG